MIVLFDNQTGAELGRIDKAQLAFLTGSLEEESAADRDYYINSATIDFLQSQGADAGLIALLRQAMVGRDEMEIRWTTSD
ncbi:MAG: galactosyldiacylglycerol synthase [Caldilineaceae bacterium]|nr:galactosyldiacylglycerol synthase [Caldilineaceae bacterium]